MSGLKIEKANSPEVHIDKTKPPSGNMNIKKSDGSALEASPPPPVSTPTPAPAPIGPVVEKRSNKTSTLRKNYSKEELMEMFKKTVPPAKFPRESAGYVSLTIFLKGGDKSEPHSHRYNSRSKDKVAVFAEANEKRWIPASQRAIANQWDEKSHEAFICNMNILLNRLTESNIPEIVQGMKSIIENDDGKYQLASNSITENAQKQTTMSQIYAKFVKKYDDPNFVKSVISKATASFSNHVNNTEDTPDDMDDNYEAIGSSSFFAALFQNELIEKENAIEMFKTLIQKIIELQHVDLIVMFQHFMIESGNYFYNDMNEEWEALSQFIKTIEARSRKSCLLSIIITDKDASNGGSISKTENEQEVMYKKVLLDFGLFEEGKRNTLDINPNDFIPLLFMLIIDKYSEKQFFSYIIFRVSTFNTFNTFNTFDCRSLEILRDQIIQCKEQNMAADCKFIWVIISQFLICLHIFNHIRVEQIIEMRKLYPSDTPIISIENEIKWFLFDCYEFDYDLDFGWIKDNNIKSALRIRDPPSQIIPIHVISTMRYVTSMFMKEQNQIPFETRKDQIHKCKKFYPELYDKERERAILRCPSIASYLK